MSNTNLSNILLIVIFNFIDFAILGQYLPQNCESARQRYLEQNPDVAKTGIDPWQHYQGYGKREGRLWPECTAKIMGLYNHDCMYLSAIQAPYSDAFYSNWENDSDEELKKLYDKITSKSPVIFRVVNGVRVCKLFFFYNKDRVVHHGEFTEEQFNALNAYKFNNLEDCLELLQMLEDIEINADLLEDNEVYVKTNISDVKINSVEDNIPMGLTQNNSLKYSFAEFKNRYLAISLSHPACRDTIIEINKRSHRVFVSMNYTVKYLEEEFERLKEQADWRLLRGLQAITTNDFLFSAVSKYADSLEIVYCSKQGTGSAIGDFLSTRPYTQCYQDAQEVKKYYEDAYAKYTSAKSVNTIKEYEYFLNNFGLSNYKDEVKQLLVSEAIRYYSKDVGSSDSLLTCYKRYVAPNLGEAWIKKYCSDIQSHIESALIAENKSTSIEQFASHWQKVLSFEQVTKFKMNSYRSSIREALSNLYFEQLKNVSSAFSQDSLVASFRSKFDTFETWIDGKDDSDDFIFNVITQASNKNGFLNLFNSSFLVNYLVSNAAGFSKEYHYKGGAYLIKTVSQKASMVWFNNNLVGEVITYDMDQMESKTTFTTFPNCDLTTIYQNGNLIVEIHYKLGSIEYSYEFDNGTNISISALSQIVNEADKLFSESKLEEAGAKYKSARNNYPPDLPVNIQLANSLANFNKAWEKHLAEKKAEEEAAAARQKSIADADEMRRKYGEDIKRDIIAILSFIPLYGEAWGEAEYDKLVSKTQSNLIHRQFTNEDSEVFNRLTEEAKAAYQGNLNLLKQNAENDKIEKQCTWCGRVFTGPSWYPDRDHVTNSCRSHESSNMGFGSGVDRCCSSKCAIEKCVNE